MNLFLFLFIYLFIKKITMKFLTPKFIKKDGFLLIFDNLGVTLKSSWTFRAQISSLDL